MKRHDLQKSELDKIGLRLISSNTVSEPEIDQIVANPYLYSSVRARISETAAPRASVFRLRYVAALALVPVVISIGIAAFMSRGGLPTQTAENGDAVKPIPVQKFAEPDRIDPITSKGAQIAQTEPRRNVPSVQNASYRKAVTDNTKGRRPIATSQPDLEFYPLTYTGDSNETTRGGRIIRVEMSRASLFAMGVNLPIENGAELIKADILVGPDGVPRGIRMPN